jgi:hypothetical protein
VCAPFSSKKTDTWNKKNRVASARDVLQLLLDGDKGAAVVALLQSVEPGDLNEILSNTAFHYRHGVAFAEVAKLDYSSGRLNPNAILAKLRDHRARERVKVVRALILHPSTRPAGAFLNACWWRLWDLANRFVEHAPEHYVRGCFIAAVRANAMETVRLLASRIDQLTANEVLRQAAKAGHVDLLRLLLDHCRKVDLTDSGFAILVGASKREIRKVLAATMAERGPKYINLV